jgi:hypothetical protein
MAARAATKAALATPKAQEKIGKVSRGQVGYTGGGATVQWYSDIQQAIYSQAVKPTGRFNDRTELKELQFCSAGWLKGFSG